MSSVNPYQGPRANVEHDDEEYSEVRLFSKGRIGRVRYILHGIGYYILIAVLFGAITAGLVAALGPSSPVVTALKAASYVAMLAVVLMLGVQRAHDFDASGWWALLALVPLVNLLFWFVPGTDGENRFGKKTPPNTTSNVVLLILLPLVFIGILAAIAIPAYQSYVQRAHAAHQSQ